MYFHSIKIMFTYSSPLLLLEDQALEDFEQVVGKEGEKNAVVVGLAPNKFNYESLNEAFR